MKRITIFLTVCLFICNVYNAISQECTSAMYCGDRPSISVNEIHQDGTKDIFVSFKAYYWNQTHMYSMTNRYRTGNTFYYEVTFDHPGGIALPAVEEVPYSMNEGKLAPGNYNVVVIDIFKTAGIYKQTLYETGSFTIYQSGGIEPAPTLQAIGPKDVCLSSIKTSTYKIPKAIGATSYIWKVEPRLAGNLQATDTSVTVTWNVNVQANSVKIYAMSENQYGYNPAFTPFVTTLSKISYLSLQLNNIDSTTVFVQANTSSNLPKYIWDFGDGTVHSVKDNSIQHTYDSSGVYTIIADAINNSCIITDTIIVNINDPKNNLITGKKNNCSNDDTLLYSCNAVNNATNYIWEIKPSHAGSLKKIDNLNCKIKWNKGYTGNVDIMVTVRNAANQNITKDTLRVYLSSTNYISSNFNIAGKSIKVNNSYGVEDAKGITWNLGDGTSFSDSISFSHLYSVNKPYIITVEQIKNTCREIDSFKIDLTKRPILRFIKDSACYNDSIIVTVDNFPNAKKYNWYCNLGSNTNSNTYIYKHTGTFKGQYTIGVGIETENGITEWSEWDTVTVNAYPSSGYISMIKTENEVELTETNNNPSLRKVNYGDGTVEQKNPMKHAYSVAGQYPITLEISDGLCTVPRLYNVTISESDLFNPIGPKNICNTEKSHYEILNNAQIKSIGWSLNPTTAGTMTTNLNTVDIAWDNSFNNNVVLQAIIVLQNDSIITKTKTIIVNKHTINVFDTLRLGYNTMRIYSKKNQICTNRWKLPNNVTFLRNTDDSCDIKCNQKGVHEITYNMTANACIDYDTIRIKNVNNATETITKPVIILANKLVCQTYNTYTNLKANTQSKASRYKWSILPKESCRFSLDEDKSASPYVYWNDQFDGTVKVALTIYDDYSMVDSTSDTVEIIVSHMPKDVKIEYSQQTNRIELRNAIVSPGVNYWYFNNRSEMFTGSPLFYTFNNTDTMKIYLEKNNKGCISRDSSYIRLKTFQIPFKPMIPVGPNTICNNANQTVYKVYPSGFATGSTWEISPNNAGTVTQSLDSLIVDWNRSFSGNVHIAVKMNNYLGVSNVSDMFDVTVFQQPEAYFDFTKQSDSLSVLFENKGKYYTSSIWNFSVNESFKDSNIVTHHFDSAGTYNVKLKLVNNSCIDSVIKSISIVEPIKISVQDISSNRVQLYPTLTKDVINIAIDDKISGELSIYNTLGIVLIKQELTSGFHKLNLKEFSKGEYIAIFKSKTSQKTFRLIKE